jgi:RNA polymerase sigma-70 factor (ECF subfamily)
METELELLNAARKMDQDALVKIFDLYASALYRYALRLCGDPVRADHLVGDVFATLLEQLSEGNGPRINLRSYLYQTIYHRIIDETRSARHRAPLEAATFLRQDTHSVSFNLEDQILFTQILHAIRDELTEDQRHVIILRFMEEFSLRETAAILGKEVNHVKVIQNRALAKLRKSLDAKAIGTPVSSAGMKPFSSAVTI